MKVVFSAHAEVVRRGPCATLAALGILRARGGSSSRLVMIFSPEAVFSAHAEVVPRHVSACGLSLSILRARGGSS